MAVATEFDAIAYWKDRHVRLRGDVRAVGHIGWSEAKNAELAAANAATLSALVARQFPQTRGLHALDLGCGVGRFAPLITDLGLAYAGVDVSPDAIAQACHRCPPGAFFEADICSFAPQRQFDLVLALYVLIHVVEDARWDAALGVIARALAPRGVGIVMEKMPETREQPAAHVVFRSIGDYRAALARHGLTIRETGFDGAYLIVRQDRP